jgi:hypothetical protein
MNEDDDELKVIEEIVKQNVWYADVIDRLVEHDIASDYAKRPAYLLKMVAESMADFAEDEFVNVILQDIITYLLYGEVRSPLTQERIDEQVQSFRDLLNPKQDNQEETE